MSTQSIIVMISVILVFVLAVGGLRRGPRITHIDRTVRREKDNDDA